MFWLLPHGASLSDNQTLSGLNLFVCLFTACTTLKSLRPREEDLSQTWAQSGDCTFDGGEIVSAAELPPNSKPLFVSLPC